MIKCPLDLGDHPDPEGGGASGVILGNVQAELDDIQILHIISTFIPFNRTPGMGSG